MYPRHGMWTWAPTYGTWAPTNEMLKRLPFSPHVLGLYLYACSLNQVVGYRVSTFSVVLKADIETLNPKP